MQKNWLYNLKLINCVIRIFPILNLGKIYCFSWLCIDWFHISRAGQHVHTILNGSLALHSTITGHYICCSALCFNVVHCIQHVHSIFFLTL